MISDISYSSSVPSQGHYVATLTYEDAADGASTAVALDDFPLGVIVESGWIEIVTEFAGEADAAVTVGDTADGDYLCSSLSLDGVAPTKMASATGSGALPAQEADWATDGLDVTFAATELGDLTAGELKVHILFKKPE